MITNRSKHRPHKNTNRLAAYLAAGVGAGILGSHDSQAGIVILDLGSFSNLNGGLPYGTFGTFQGGNANSGRIDISFLNYYNLPYTGIAGNGSLGNLVTGIAAGCPFVITSKPELLLTTAEQGKVWEDALGDY